MQQKCTKHLPSYPKEKLLFFCVEKECQKRLVCRECENAIHSGHELIYMNDFKNYYKPNIISQYNENINNIITATKEIQKLAGQICTNIQRTFTKVQVSPHITTALLTEEILNEIVQLQDGQKRLILEQFSQTLNKQTLILKQILQNTDPIKIKEAIETEKKITKKSVRSDWGSISLQNPCKFNVQHENSTIALSPCGRYIASAGGEEDFFITIVDPKLRQFVGQLNAYVHKEVKQISYSRCGNFIVSCGSDNAVRQWKVSTQEQIGQPMYHKDQVIGVSYSSDGLYIISGSWDGTIRLWNSKTQKELIDKRIQHRNQIYALVFKPNSTYIALGDEMGIIQVWNYQHHRKQGKSLRGHTKRLEVLQYSPNGRFLVSGGLDCRIILWDGCSGQKIRIIIDYDQKSSFYSFSPDMKYILLPHRSILKNFVTFEEIIKKPILPRARKGIFSLDGKYIILGQYRADILIYEL